MSTIHINDTDRIRTTILHRGTISVRVIAERLTPYPEGTIGHDNGESYYAEIYGENVDGGEVRDAAARNKLGTLGAYVDVPPSQERLDAAFARAHAALAARA